MIGLSRYGSQERTFIDLTTVVKQRGLEETQPNGEHNLSAPHRYDLYKTNARVALLVQKWCCESSNAIVQVSPSESTTSLSSNALPKSINVRNAVLSM